MQTTYTLTCAAGQTCTYTGQPLKPLTDAQIESQIDNLRWQEKQSDVQNQFNRQNTLQQQRIEHEHYMVDHLADPIVAFLLILVIAITAAYISRKAIAAGVEKNRDDNASDVRRAQDILDKHEGVSE